MSRTQVSQLASQFMIRAFLLLFLPLLFALPVAAQPDAALQDVVYLKNGSIIRGTLLELTPGQMLRIQTADGSLFVYRLDEVERMTKEPARGTAAALPPAPPTRRFTNIQRPRRHFLLRHCHPSASAAAARGSITRRHAGGTSASSIIAG